MTINMEDDVEDQSSTIVDPILMEKVTRLAKKLRSKKILLEESKRQLEILEKEIFLLETKDIPDTMDEIGLRQFVLTSGEKIEISSVLKASIPKSKEDEAFGWLRNHGFQDLIKRQVAVKLTRGHDEVADTLVKEIQKLGLSPEDKQTVHWQTLNAWVKEQINAGEDLPQDLFGIYIGRKATVVIEQ